MSLALCKQVVWTHLWSPCHIFLSTRTVSVQGGSTYISFLEEVKAAQEETSTHWWCPSREQTTQPVRRNSNSKRVRGPGRTPHEVRKEDQGSSPSSATALFPSVKWDVFYLSCVKELS